jgi:hypothetical protein
LRIRQSQHAAIVLRSGVNFLTRTVCVVERRANRRDNKFLSCA